MILVSVGTQKFPMNRLIEAVDRMAEERIFSEEVWMQTGYSTYEPKYCRSARFFGQEEMHKKIKECSLLICHAGVGTILSGIKNGKKVIVMPRYQKYGEHVDDHQLEIAKAFAQSGYVRMVWEAKELPELVKEIEYWKSEPFVSNTDHFLSILLKELKNYG